MTKTLVTMVACLALAGAASADDAAGTSGPRSRGKAMAASAAQPATPPMPARPPIDSLPPPVPGGYDMAGPPAATAPVAPRAETFEARPASLTTPVPEAVGPARTAPAVAFASPDST